VKTLSRFDQHNSVYLRAVLQEGTLIGDLNSRLLHVSLCEVFLLPENEESITKKFLRAAGFDSVEEIMSFYDPASSLYPRHAVCRQYDLLNEFTLNWRLEDTAWHYSVVKLAAGPDDQSSVISVIFGKKSALRQAREMGRLQPQEVAA